MTKTVRIAAWPIRMSEEIAAHYLSVSRSKFRQLVAEREYPQPVRERGRIYWSKLQIDSYVARQFGHPHLAHLEDTSWSDLRQNS